jgi:hypothetical protein
MWGDECAKRICSPPPWMPHCPCCLYSPCDCVLWVAAACPHRYVGYCTSDAYIGSADAGPCESAWMRRGDECSCSLHASCNILVTLLRRACFVRVGALPRPSLSIRTDVPRPPSSPMHGPSCPHASPVHLVSEYCSHLWVRLPWPSRRGCGVCLPARQVRHGQRAQHVHRVQVRLPLSFPLEVSAITQIYRACQVCSCAL